MIDVAKRRRLITRGQGSVVRSAELERRTRGIMRSLNNKALLLFTVMFVVCPLLWAAGMVVLEFAR